MAVGQDMYALCAKMFPYCRSITGDGVRATLKDLQSVVPEIKLYEIPSGTNVFDWTIPEEWNIREGWIKNSKGEDIVNFRDNNLHIMGYSAPIDKKMSLDELKKILYTQPNQPDVIPYVTSYYKRRCGFCMSENLKQSLKEDTYHVYIDSEFTHGNLSYGELIIPGGEKEVFFSTYVCHPSMANNELSGPAVVVYLAKWIKALAKRRYTYRIIFIPETIGSIAYLSKHLTEMQKNMVAGFNVSCVGDDRTFSYVESRYGNTLSDRVAKNVLKFYCPNYKAYSFLRRGSDERQYNAPGVDLPVCAICRSKYGEYPEYHTSKDNLQFISPMGLEGAYEVYKQCVLALEENRKYRVACLGEPNLGRRGLYPTISQKGNYDAVAAMRDFLAYADGNNDVIAISDIIGVSVRELLPIIKELKENELIVEVA